MTAAPNLANAPEFTVSELSSALRRTVEDAYGHVRVRGEISGFRGPQSSGHCYFALKDENAKIEAVVWKFVHVRMRFKPQEGLEVIATGKLTTYPGSSKYQIVIEALEPAGIGALMALMEERKKKLAAEGLFDPARKQLLPYLPRVIGVVTSPTGAVIRDILHRLEDRFPRRVLVWPVKVQGDGSAEQVAAAIRGFNALPQGGAIPRPDLLIVARGGGSLEDLWSFNEEIVVRAAADSVIPLISAVGHETDITLIDFVADKRAPTPTAAAEMAVPVRSELFVEVATLARRTLVCWQRHQDGRRNELRAAVRALPGPGEVLAIPRQRLDAAASALPRSLKTNTHVHFRQFAGVSARLTLRVLRGQVTQAGHRLIVGGEADIVGARPAAPPPRPLQRAGGAAESLEARQSQGPAASDRARARTDRAPCRSCAPRAAHLPAAARCARQPLRTIAHRALLSLGAGARLCVGARWRRTSAACGGQHRAKCADRDRIRRRPRGGNRRCRPACGDTGITRSCQTGRARKAGRAKTHHQAGRSGQPVLARNILDVGRELLPSPLPYARREPHCASHSVTSFCASARASGSAARWPRSGEALSALAAFTCSGRLARSKSW